MIGADPVVLAARIHEKRRGGRAQGETVGVGVLHVDLLNEVDSAALARNRVMANIRPAALTLHAPVASVVRSAVGDRRNARQGERVARTFRR